MPRPKKTKNVDEVVEPPRKQIADLNAQIDAEPADQEFAMGSPFEEMTLAKFKKQFKDEIESTMDNLANEAAEGTYKTKKQLKEAAIAQVQENHPEISIV